MLTRRTFASVAAAALCRPAVSRAAPSRVLRFVPQVAYSTPDPVWTTAIVVQTHAFMVWDTLYGVDIDLTPQPQMCEGHTVSDDQLTWTFSLRPSLRFHDSTPVRAVDAVQSIRRWAPRNTFGQRLAAEIDEMAALDDTKFRLRLKSPFPLMLYALGAENCFIMPEHIAKTSPSEPIKQLIGSGPFRFRADEWVSGVHSVYERFDQYQARPEPPDFLAGGKLVHFDRVEWSIQPDAGTAVSALQAGEVDWIDQPLFDLVPALKRNKDVTVQQLDPFGLIGIIALNHLYPPFDNLKLRQALLPAINQHEYVAAVLGDQVAYSTLPVGYFTAGSPMASDAGLQALTVQRDPALAQKLVTESGYKGERIILMSPSDQPQMHAMAEVTYAVFKQLGLNVEMVAMDWGTLLSRRASRKPPSEGGWSAFNTRLTGLGAADPASAQLRGNGLKAWFGWPTEPKLDVLSDDWFHAPDRPAQREIAARMQQAAFAAVPYIPLGQWSQPTAHRADLTGFVRSSNPLFWGVRRN